MNLFSDVFFVGQWDPEIGGRRIENRVQKGESIPEGHLRAWRVAREEILGNILIWSRLVMENYFAWTGKVVDRERILHTTLPEELWRRVELFLRHLADLPCWIDRNLSLTIFGAKQTRDFWHQVFQRGIAPNQVRVLTEPLDVNRMIQDFAPRRAGLT